MGYSNLSNPGNYQMAAFGQKGFNYLRTGALSASGNFNAVQVIADSTVTCVASTGESLTAVEVPAGITIVGKFTYVSIATGGGALVYNG
jgi:hypothetical protein